MTSEEYILRQQFPAEHHFKVPDGYFRDFHRDMMELIAREEAVTTEQKETKKTSRVRSLRPIYWAAACVAGLAIALTAFLRAPQQDADSQPLPLLSSHASTQEDELDNAFDYYMIDENEAYNLLAEY